ncbi:MAG: hypothetical protein ABIV21_09555 [Pyrinomonadaceae bacterium]
MAKPYIYLAFTDDWELRGDGSGDLDKLQFKPMQRLLDMFDRYGVRSTFMVEAMQQLTFRAHQKDLAELEGRADQWDANVREAHSRGHDIQLHIHPQWSDANLINGGWSLKGDWSLPNYPSLSAAEMIHAGKTYLEDLLRPFDPDYNCVAFRSGSSVIAPSQFMLGLLAEQGFVFDLSIVGGLLVNTRNVQFDYTDCDEDFVPYYPLMTDARRLSRKVEPIICVPIFSFIGSPRSARTQIIAKARAKLLKTGSRSNDASYASNEWAEIGRSSFIARLLDKVIKPALIGKPLTADTGQLSFPLLCEMLDHIRSRARSTGLADMPVILTNHSKYMTDLSAMEKFLAIVSTAEDIRTITLTELAGHLQSGKFRIMKADAG